MKFTQTRVMTYGEYRAKVIFYHKKVSIGCTDFIAEVTPSDKDPSWLNAYLKNDTKQ